MPSGYLKHAKGISKKKTEGSSTKHSRKGIYDQDYGGVKLVKGKNYNKWERCHTWEHHSPGRFARRVPLESDASLDRDYQLVPPPSPEPLPPRTFDGFCMVCMDDPVSVLDLGKCGHTACQACLEQSTHKRTSTFTRCTARFATRGSGSSR